MKIFRVFLILALLTGTWGCAGMSATQQRVLSGSAIGTAAGAGMAAILGGPIVLGAVAGAAAGAAGGIIVDELQGR